MTRRSRSVGALAVILLVVCAVVGTAAASRGTLSSRRHRQKPIPVALRGTWTSTVDAASAAVIGGPDGTWKLKLSKHGLQLTNPDGFTPGSVRARLLRRHVIAVANDPDCPGETSGTGGAYRYELVGDSLQLTPTRSDACAPREGLLKLQPWQRSR